MFVIIAPLISGIKGEYSNGDIRGIIKKYNYSEKLPIVATKYNARGSYFYTGRNILVLCMNNKPFWSPEAVPVISTNKQIKVFFDSYNRLLCVIDKKEFQRINKIFKNTRNNIVLYHNGDRIVIMSNKLY